MQPLPNQNSHEGLVDCIHLYIHLFVSPSPICFSPLSTPQCSPAFPPSVFFFQSPPTAPLTAAIVNNPFLTSYPPSLPCLCSIHPIPSLPCFICSPPVVPCASPPLRIHQKKHQRVSLPLSPCFLFFASWFVFMCSVQSNTQHASPQPPLPVFLQPMLKKHGMPPSVERRDGCE